MTKNPVYDNDTINRLRALVKDCPTWLEARAILAKDLGVHEDNVTRLNRRRGIWVSPNVGTVTATTQSGDTFDTAVETSKASTLEEVMDLCKVDTTKWESAGFSVRRGAKGFAWSARFKKKEQALDVDGLVKAFVERAEKHAPRFKDVKPIKRAVKTGRLLEMSIPDLHLAKLCWAQETGHRDYDIKIAAALFREAASSLLESARGMGIGRILFPVGNDLMNSDNAAGTTTAGTPQAQSEDSRWKKTFMTACDLITEVVEQLAREFPVDVVIVAGNHDEERCFYLGQCLKSWFRNHPNVTVDNSATQRKYYRFGSTLIGFTHGDEEKSDRLPLIMAQERKADWTETEHREWHLGHQHRLMVNEDVGCKLRWLPSLCPPDEWMASKGYIGNDQAAEAFVYDAKGGMIACLYFRA